MSCQGMTYLRLKPEAVHPNQNTKRPAIDCEPQHASVCTDASQCKPTPVRERMGYTPQKQEIDWIVPWCCSSVVYISNKKRNAIPRWVFAVIHAHSLYADNERAGVAFL